MGVKTIILQIGAEYGCMAQGAESVCAGLAWGLRRQYTALHQVIWTRCALQCPLCPTFPLYVPPLMVIWCAVLLQCSIICGAIYELSLNLNLYLRDNNNNNNKTTTYKAQ